MMKSNHDLVGALRPRLEFRHLSLLVAIDAAGSVTRAAELLGITQPALSRQIREAERRLGTELYSRVNKRLRPTAAGECLLENAKRILLDLERAETDAIQIPAAPQHVVRLGAGAYSGFHWLPDFLRRLQDNAPDIDVVVAGQQAQRPQDALVHGEIDLAIAAGPVDARGVRVLPLFEDELVAILPPDHRLAGRPVLGAQDFAEQTYITYSPTYEKGFETDRVLRPAKVWPRKLVKVELTDTIVDLVSAGFGVSVLSRWAVSAAARAGAVALAKVTDEGLPIQWTAAVRRADGERAPAARLARELARWCREEPLGFANAPLVTAGHR